MNHGFLKNLDFGVVSVNNKRAPSLNRSKPVQKGYGCFRVGFDLNIYIIANDNLTFKARVDDSEASKLGK